MNPFHVSKEQVIEKNIAALGSPFMKKLSLVEVNALGRYFGSTPLLDTIPCFKRVQICGSVYHSISYTRVTACNSYTILYEDHNSNDLLIGQVDFYFQYKLPCANTLSCTENCVCPVQNFALVRGFSKIPDFNFVEDPLTHATGLQITAVYLPEPESLRVIPISAIKEKLVYMFFKGEEIAFVSRFPNSVESD